MRGVGARRGGIPARVALPATSPGVALGDSVAIDGVLPDGRHRGRRRHRVRRDGRDPRAAPRSARSAGGDQRQRRARDARRRRASAGTSCRATSTRSARSSPSRQDGIALVVEFAGPPEVLALRGREGVDRRRRRQPHGVGRRRRRGFEVSAHPAHPRRDDARRASSRAGASTSRSTCIAKYVERLRRRPTGLPRAGAAPGTVLRVGDPMDDPPPPVQLASRTRIEDIRAGKHGHRRRRRGPRERGRPLHGRRDGHAGAINFMARVRPRPHLPDPHRRSAATSSACR